MADANLFLISANKSRPSGQWPDADYHVRDGRRMAWWNLQEDALAFRYAFGKC